MKSGRRLQRLAGLSLAFALAAEANGQDDATTGQVTIDELRSPTSPAFTILDVAPTNVVRPNTPREFAIELLSAKDRSDGELPSDLAIELAPYWLGDHPDLTFEQYYAPEGIGQTIMRSFAISVATSAIPDPTVDGTTLGLGVRFHLVPGKPAPGLMDSVAALKSAQLEFLDCVEDISDEPVEGDDLAAGCDDAKMRTAGAEVRALDLQRTGWIVEAALAGSRDYPSANGSQSRARQFGTWLTASYKVRDPNSLTLLAAVRLLEDKTGSTSVTMRDAGGRFIFESGHMPLSLSLEVMHRDIEDGESSTSVLGVLEYPINDTLRLVASYGKGLATPTRDSDIEATISVNFGFGKGPSVSFENLTK